MASASHCSLMTSTKGCLARAYELLCPQFYSCDFLRENNITTISWGGDFVERLGCDARAIQTSCR